MRWIVNSYYRSILLRVFQAGLPNHVCPDQAALEENDHRISCILKKADDRLPHRRAVCADDRTHVVGSFNFGQTSKGHILAGGCHRPPGFTEADESQIPLQTGEPTEEQNYIIKTENIVKAREVECFLIWDPTIEHSPVLDAATYPVPFKASLDDRFQESMGNKAKTSAGKWEALMRAGIVFDKLKVMKFHISDAHASHDWVGAAMLGRNIPIPKNLLELVPFFSRLTKEDLPHCCMRIPYRVVKIDSETVHHIPGVFHAQKNFAEELRKHLKTLRLGKKWSDPSGALDLGLFLLGYIGPDGMSDFQAALLCAGFGLEDFVYYILMCLVLRTTKIVLLLVPSPSEG